MLFVWRRAPLPPARVWRGRRLLAALDAVVWPTLWIAGVLASPFGMGVVGASIFALACCAGFSRLWKAVNSNENYRFTILRWGRPVFGLLAMGAFLNLWRIYGR
jgi:hypothetical protein